MKKIRPQNPIYLILILFIPWHFINTYYSLKSDTLTISRYYARKNSNDFDKKVDTIDMKKLVTFGLPKDFGTTIQEPTIRGKKERTFLKKFSFFLRIAVL